MSRHRGMYSTRSSGSTNKFYSLPSISFVTNITQCFHVYKAMDGHFCATHAYTTEIGTSSNFK